MDQPLLFRPEEAAKALGLGRTKTYQLLAAGELPKVVIGRAVRVPRVALEAWIARQVAERGSDDR